MAFDLVGSHTVGVPEDAQVSVEKSGTIVRLRFRDLTGDEQIFRLPAHVALAARDAFNDALDPRGQVVALRRNTAHKPQDVA